MQRPQDGPPEIIDLLTPPKTDKQMKTELQTSTKKVTSVGEARGAFPSPSPPETVLFPECSGLNPNEKQNAHKRRKRTIDAAFGDEGPAAPEASKLRKKQQKVGSEKAKVAAKKKGPHGKATGDAKKKAARPARTRKGERTPKRKIRKRRRSCKSKIQTDVEIKAKVVRTGVLVENHL